jgi:signal transduction histidine kinase
MFKRTRRQLAMLNALVFFIFLVGFSAILYSHIHYRLLSGADNMLLRLEKRLESRSLDELYRSGRRDPAGDRQIVYLFWGRQGELLEQIPKPFFPPDELDPLRSKLDSRSLHTVNVGGFRYRVLTLPNPVKMTPEGDEAVVASVQLVRSLEAEDKVLGSLKLDIAAGCLAGALIAVVAGFFLAGRALVPIRRSWERQRQFAANASHELRTPTAVIQARAELLFRHPGRTIQEESENIAVILNESRRMGKLIGDLLTLARSDSDQIQLRTAPARLDRIIEDTVRAFADLAEMKNVRVTTVISGPLSFLGDEERIRQLLVILLDNAVKFTPPQGSVQVIGTRQGNTLRLIVKDSGCGIPAGDIPGIFERFYRGDKTRSRGDGGTGLGLSIAKWIVEAHGGKIEVHSEPSKGTEMRVTFPVRKM